MRSASSTPSESRRTDGARAVTMRRQRRRFPAVALAVASALLLHCSPAPLPPPASKSVSVSDWPAYGGDLGGQRYAEVETITRTNVTHNAIASTMKSNSVNATKKLTKVTGLTRKGLTASATLTV